MKRILYSFLYILIVSSVSGKTTVVTTEYIYQIPENISPDQARETALTRARAQAIANEFGTSINQVTSVIIENENGNSSSDFLSLGGSELKGEWIEDLESPIFEYITDGENIAIKVKIKGRIRETKGSKVNVNAKILRNGTLDSYEADQFVSGDDMYISFSAPIDGYTAVYLLDNADNAFCLLPYQSQTDGIFKTKGNQKYLFFHPEYSNGFRPSDIDRIVVDTDLDRERNRILILFSPNKFFKGADEKQCADLPRVMNLIDFKKWMTNLVKKDTDLIITERSILISSNK